MSDSALNITISAKNLTADQFEAVKKQLGEIGVKAHETGESASGLKDKFTELGGALKDFFENPLQGGRELASLLGGDLMEALGGLGAAGGAAAGAMAGIAAAAVGLGATIFGLADHAAEAGESVLAFSQKTGIAVENVGPLEFAVKAAGGSLDQLSGILQKVDMKAATDSGGRFSAALADIGIKADDFKKMDSEAQVMALARGFQTGSASGNDMADALAIMGRSGAEAIPMLKKMTDDLVTSGQTLGVQWNEDNVHASEVFKTSLNEVEEILGGVATKIGVAVLPAVADMMSGMVSSPGFINGVTEAVGLLSDGLGYAVEIVGNLTASAMDLLAPLIAVGTFVGTLMVDAFKGVVGYLGDAYVAFSKMTIVQDIAHAMSDAWTGFRDMFVSAFHDVMGYLEALPVIGPKIKDAMDNATSAFKGTTDAAKDVAGASDRVATALINQSYASGQATEGTKAHNRAHTDGVDAAAKYEAAVQKLVDKLLGENQSYLQTSASIDRAIAAGSDDVDVKTRIAEEIQKLIEGHHTLDAAQSQFWSQNATLTKQGQAAISLTQKMWDDSTVAYLKDTEGQTAATLAANQSWYNSQKAAIDKMIAAGQDMSSALDALREVKTQKDNKAIDDQVKAQQAFDASTLSMWDAHYAALAGLAGVDAATKNKHLDDQLAAEKAKLLEDTDITWAEYYDRIAALDANNQDKKTANLKQQAKAEKGQRDTNTLDWDGYYVDLAKLHKTDAMDVELQQTKDGFQKQIDALDPDASGYQAALSLLVARQGLAADQIKQNYHDKAVQPMIDDTTRTLYDGIMGGWSAMKKDIEGILSDLLNTFLRDFVAGIIGSATGATNAWSSAFGNISGWVQGIEGKGNSIIGLASKAASAWAHVGAGGASAGIGADVTVTGGTTGLFGSGGVLAGTEATMSGGGGGAGAVAALGTVAAIAGPALLAYEIWSHGGTGDPTEANKASDNQRQSDYDQYGSDPNNPTYYDLKWGNPPPDDGQSGGQVFGGGVRAQGDGGGPTSIGVPGMAEGGIVTRPTLRIFGEAGPEAVVPLDRYDAGKSDMAAAIQALQDELRGLRGDFAHLPYTLGAQFKTAMRLAT